MEIWCLLVMNSKDDDRILPNLTQKTIRKLREDDATYKLPVVRSDYRIILT